MTGSILDQYREVLERDLRRRQATLNELRHSLSSTSALECNKRNALETGIRAGEQMLQAAEARLSSVEKTAAQANGA